MTTDREQLREQVRQAVEQGIDAKFDADMPDYWPDTREWSYKIADAVLAVPAVADALTAADTLRRVRTEVDDQPPHHTGCHCAGCRVRSALEVDFMARWCGRCGRHHLHGQHDSVRAPSEPPLEPFASWQEQSAAMPPPDDCDCRGMDERPGCTHGRPPRDDDYHPAAINRDQETT